MTNVRLTKNQMSICQIRRRYHLPCRDCECYDECDPVYRQIMTYDIDTDKNNENEREVNNGYQ